MGAVLTNHNELGARLAGRRNDFSGIVDFEVRWHTVVNGGII